MTYDIAIIGAGPGGYTAADEAARRGLSVVLFEHDRVGRCSTTPRQGPASPSSTHERLPW